MLIEAFGGIIKFNHKVVIATVTGHITSLESCDVIKKGHPNYGGLYLQSFQHTKNLPKMFLIHIKKKFRNLKTSYRVFNFQLTKLISWFVMNPSNM